MRRRILQARVEIERCNVYTRRVYTALHDEEAVFHLILQDLKAQEDPIFGAVEEHVMYRRRLNRRVARHIHKIFTLEGFTGDKSIGKKKGDSLLQPVDRVDVQGNADFEENDDGEEAGDDVEREMDGIIDFMASLAVI